MRIRDATSVTFSDGGRTVVLSDMVDAWAVHVVRLFRELDTSVAETPSAWGAHDLVAALYARDRVKAGLDTCPGVDGTLAVVEATDELFRCFTVEDERDLLGLVGYDIPRAPWWWRRVPTRGPVATELTEIAERLAQAN